MVWGMGRRDTAEEGNKDYEAGEEEDKEQEKNVRNIVLDGSRRAWMTPWYCQILKKGQVRCGR